jgi:hypothetical protein
MHLLIQIVDCMAEVRSQILTRFGYILKLKERKTLIQFDDVRANTQDRSHLTFGIKHHKRKCLGMDVRPHKIALQGLVEPTCKDQVLQMCERKICCKTSLG